MRTDLSCLDPIGSLPRPDPARERLLGRRLQVARKRLRRALLRHPYVLQRIALQLRFTPPLPIDRAVAGKPSPNRVAACLHAARKADLQGYWGGEEIQLSSHLTPERSTAVHQRRAALLLDALRVRTQKLLPLVAPLERLARRLTDLDALLTRAGPSDRPRLEKERRAVALHVRDPLLPQRAPLLRQRLDAYRRALNAFVEPHLRLAARIAQRRRDQGTPLPDLLQEGACVLLRAAESFDPTRGLPFFAYAVPWLRFHFRKVVLKEVEDGDGMESLDTDFLRPGDEGDFCGQIEEINRAATIADPDALPADESADLALRRDSLTLALDRLSYREREVVRLRWGLDGCCYTLEETARIFKVTRERARQIEKKALAKLKANPDLQRLMETP